jgi:ribosomal protein L24E
MPKCSYCGQQYEFPRGLTLVKVDGTVNHLCSSKCRKNMKMKRRKVRWINKKAAELAQEETAEESTGVSEADIKEEQKKK